MPSSKAVLRDIHDLKLDPSVVHNSTKASGRLKQGDVEIAEITVEVYKAPVTLPAKIKRVEGKKPIIMEFVKLPESPTPLPTPQVEEPQDLNEEIVADMTTGLNDDVSSDDTVVIQAMVDEVVKPTDEAIVMTDDTKDKKKGKKISKLVE